MILEHYYVHIKNYRRDDGKAFMENVYSTGNVDKQQEANG
jgi:D-mannonate dehydratase